MIIKNRFGKVVLISLVSTSERAATKKEVLEYFLNRIDIEKINVSSKLPFLWGDDRVLFGNLEVKNSEDVFNIFMNVISSTQKELALSRLDKRPNSEQ